MRSEIKSSRCFHFRTSEPDPLPVRHASDLGNISLNTWGLKCGDIRAWTVVVVQLSSSLQ